MGGCFSKKKTRSSSGNNIVTPSDQQFDLDQNVMKKEVFVIKHRISHESDRHSGQGTCKEEVSRLSRSKSTGTQNPNLKRRRHSRSKRSFDFDLNTLINNANDDDTLDGQTEITISTRTSSSRRREERRSSSKERRISISPGRRSESPSPSLRNLNNTASSTNRPPAKMVSVPATHKTNNAAGAVKRIHVKRNVSPLRRTNLCLYTETRSQEQTQQQEKSNTRAADQRRKSLVEIDNSTPSNTITKPTYASLLLEDIHNFHHTNTNRPAASPQVFTLPECVNKAYSIMEAVADLNSNTRWRNPITINSLSAAIQVKECQKPNSTDPTTQDCQVTQYPNNPSTAYSITNCTTVDLA